MMLMTGFILLFWLSYICAITDSWLLLMLCSLITGFIRMALTLINLFALILYAFKIEASDIITPGAEATDPKPKASHNLSFISFSCSSRKPVIR